VILGVGADAGRHRHCGRTVDIFELSVVQLQKEVPDLVLAERLGDQFEALTDADLDTLGSKGRT
jgi:hypothetical protein